MAFQWLRKKALRFGLQGNDGTSRLLQAVIQQMPNGAVYVDADAESFISEGYQGHPTVYACVSLIARTAAQIPLVVYRKTPDGLEKVGTSDADAGLLAELVTEQPNGMQGAQEFVEALITDKLIAGEYFAELVRPGSGPNAEKVSALHHMPSTYVTVHLGDSVETPIRAYSYDQGRQQYFSPDNILHGKFYNPHNYWRGQSPMQAAVRAITRGNAYETWNVTLAQNLGKPGGILNFESTLTTEQQDDVRELWYETQAGSYNAGKVLMLGALKEYIETGMSPADAEWLEGSKDVRDLITSVYGVPGELIGNKNATHENRRFAQRALHENAVFPVLDSLCSEMNRAVASTYGDDFVIGYDQDSVPAMQEDADSVVDRHVKLFEAGAITDLELREAVGFDVEIGDGTRYIPANRIPVTRGDGQDIVERAHSRLKALGIHEYTNREHTNGHV